MRTETIEFFNIAEVREGVLYRYPLDMCDALQVPEYDGQESYVREYRGHRPAG